MGDKEDIKAQKKKLDEQFKHLYQREQDLEDRWKDFELQRARVKQTKEELDQKKEEVNTINTELKMKQKMLISLEDKIKEVEGPAGLADKLMTAVKVIESFWLDFHIESYPQ